MAYRRLEARLDKENRIDLWVCSACAWTKQPENRHTGPTANTLHQFDQHKCEDHRGKPK
jgi:hypothetical protein